MVIARVLSRCGNPAIRPLRPPLHRLDSLHRGNFPGMVDIVMDLGYRAFRRPPPAG
jgi:hypothetical protein